jgi:hypothetical protein
VTTFAWKAWGTALADRAGKYGGCPTGTRLVVGGQQGRVDRWRGPLGCRENSEKRKVNAMKIARFSLLVSTLIVLLLHAHSAAAANNETVTITDANGCPGYTVTPGPSQQVTIVNESGSEVSTPGGGGKIVTFVATGLNAPQFDLHPGQTFLWTPNEAGTLLLCLGCCPSEPKVIVGPLSAPAMPPWGMVGLVLVLALCGVWFAGQRRAVSA